MLLQVTNNPSRAVKMAEQADDVEDALARENKDAHINAAFMQTVR